MVAVQAAALGSAQSIQTVQGQSGGGRHHQRLAQVAQSLGVDVQKLQDAVKQARQTAKSPDEFIQSVASQIGVDPTRVKDAFDQVFKHPQGTGGPGRPGSDRDNDGDGNGGGLAKIASALGVDTATLLDAMKQVEGKQSQDFLAQLATQLQKDPKAVNAAFHPAQADPSTTGALVDAQA